MALQARDRPRARTAAATLPVRPSGRIRPPTPARARAGNVSPLPFQPLADAFELYFKDAFLERCPAPPRLREAMRYAALGPGKRLRPLLVLLTCEAVGGDWLRALPAAVAVECVHAFSLVHDDLPAMDNDDYRRGRLTTHKRFGEALGILAGDALLAFAFEELAMLEGAGVAPAQVIDAVRRLAHASGADDLVGGQALDMASEGKRVIARKVEAIHTRKTGALMGAAMALGAIAGGAEPRTVAVLDDAGRMLGFAFQIHDDLLNAGSSLRRLGKRAGTDEARGKATYHRAAGREAAQRKERGLLRATRGIIETHCPHPARLLTLLDAMAVRER
jgi:geranylgeranyl pyrophosphate synthase